MFAIPWLLGTLLACAGGEDDDDDDDADSGDPVAPSPDRPEVQSADAYCYLHDVGDPYWQWELLAEATDPQGIDTLATTATVDAVIATGDVVASPTIVRYAGESQFFGGFKERDFDMLCGEAADYTFRFVVADQDGHASDAVEVVGRRE